jgi:hypothetical protein
MHTCRSQTASNVFALGSVIIKPSHLHNPGIGRHTEIDYSYAGVNELKAVAIAKSIIKEVPETFFAGKALALSLASSLHLHHFHSC